MFLPCVVSQTRAFFRSWYSGLPQQLLQPGYFSLAFYPLQGHTWAVGRPLLCCLEGSDHLLLSAHWAWPLHVQPQVYSPVSLSLDPRGRKPGYIVRVLNTHFHPMWNVLSVQRNTRKGSDLCTIKNAWERTWPWSSLGMPLHRFQGSQGNCISVSALLFLHIKCQ